MGNGKSRLDISEGRLRQNYAALLRSAAEGDRPVPVLAVIKANAYGHGAELCAPVLVAAGAEWMGVTDAEEGARVRRALLSAGGAGANRTGILVMCGLLPQDVDTIAENDLTPVVWTPEQLGWLANAAAHGRTIDLHLEIDTGMSRQGAAPGRAVERFCEVLRSAPEFRLGGVMTHFASAEIAGSAATVQQKERFASALAQIWDFGLRPSWVHVGNSSTVDEGSSSAWLLELADRYRMRPMLRAGLALFGYSLPLEGATGTLQRELRPVLTWTTRVLAMEEIEAGVQVGYHGTFTSANRMIIATVPVGYADGLRRELSGTDAKEGGWMMTRGCRAAIVGRISMNLTTLDVTSIAGLAVGDEVVVLGEGISAEQHARLAETIAYEILCGVRGETCPIA